MGGGGGGVFHTSHLLLNIVIASNRVFKIYVYNLIFECI